MTYLSGRSSGSPCCTLSVVVPIVVCLTGLKPSSHCAIILRWSIRSHCPTPTIGDVNRPTVLDFVKKWLSRFFSPTPTKSDRKQGHTRLHRPTWNANRRGKSGSVIAALPPHPTPSADMECESEGKIRQCYRGSTPPPPPHPCPSLVSFKWSYPGRSPSWYDTK